MPNLFYHVPLSAYCIMTFELNFSFSFHFEMTHDLLLDGYLLGHTYLFPTFHYLNFAILINFIKFSPNEFFQGSQTKVVQHLNSYNQFDKFYNP